MSTAEITARHLYDSMHLSSMNEDVKRYLMILILSESKSICAPSSYEEALAMGAINLEDARKKLHSYAEELSVK